MWRQTVTLINRNNSPLENPPGELGKIPLLYFKYHQTCLNTSASSRIHKKIRKKKKETERNGARAIK